MGEQQGVRDRMERFQERLVKHGTPREKAEKITRETVKRLEYDGRLDKVARKERRQRDS